MAKKKRKINPDLSYNPILDYETDWMEDPSNGHKQFSGESVQRFVKGELQHSFGYSRMTGNMLQHFRSIEDADAFDGGDTSKLLDQTDMSGKTNIQFKFQDMPIGSNIYINGSRPYVLPIYVKSVEVDNEGNETPTSSMVTLTINVTRNGNTTSTVIGLYEPNAQHSVNIRPYISGGATFTIMASDDQGNRRTSQRYTVVVTSMYMETRNNTWWASAYRQGGEWPVPLMLDVNIDCRLNARLVKDGTTYVTKTVLREDFLTNYDLTLGHPLDNGGSAGVYQLVLELVCTDETLQTAVPTQTLEFNVFCVGADETESFFLVNNIADSIVNYANNKLFDYAVFGNNATLGFTSVVGAVTVQSTTGLHPESETASAYYVELEVERADTNDFTLCVTGVFNGDEVLSESITVTNTSGYAATPGSVVFIKAAGRDNSEADRAKLFNIATGGHITPDLSGVSFSASDGWKRRTMTDKGGNEVAVSFFRILGDGSMTLPDTFKPLKMNASEGRTLEMMFQPRNILNEDTPIITCLEEITPAGEPATFVGLKVTSSKITLLTTNSQDEDNQSKAYDNAEPIHLAIVANPAYTEAGESYDACFIYINGVKQREFAYNRDLNVNARLVIGSTDADVDLYGIRAYNSALTTEELQQNAANWKISLYEKAQFKAQCDIKEGGKVDFNKVRALCNVFVFKATDGSGSFPHFGMTKGQTINGTLKTFWRDTPSWNKTLVMDIEGQGTSSMEYWRWNFKGSSDDPIDFDGGTHTAIKKLCGKKNAASSMQSHKMGGCEAFDYLARATGAVEQDAARQAIWQYPFVGFVEDGEGNKTFIGLYTIGPDKGDKGTFGFGSNTIAMEGLDNDVYSANFRVPWNDNTVSPDSKNEKYYVCNEKAWEDSMKNADGVASRWKPAYNLVYECSQLIRPWKGARIGQVEYAATEQGLIDYGTDLADIDTTTAAGKAQYDAATQYEYWITGTYKLFFYNPATQAYMQSYTTAAINLSNQLCGHGYKVGETTSGNSTVAVYLTTQLLSEASSDDERNELFKKARIDKFRQEASDYWDIRNAMFHLGWVEFDAATDNLAKNTYPYLLNVLDNTKKIRWRQDDVDTVFPIENQGKDKKPYCVELEDDYSDYGMSPLAVFNGRRSQFWFTLKEAFADEYDTFMRETFIPALTGYRPALGILGSVMAFFQDFYFSRAQEYFGAALYNADSTYCYEQAHLAPTYTTHRNIALQQLLGDHYSAEKRWIRMRAIYMMSKYKAGLFAAGTTADAFATRVSSGQNTYTLTPAIYMYPSVDFGQTVYRGERFWPGSNIQSWTTPVFQSDGDQSIRFHGMSYLRDVGNLYNNTLKDSITVYAPMLRQLLLGNKDAVSAVASQGITSVLIDSASTLRKIDLSRLVNLAGTVDLSACVNLRELYLDNTAITQLNISNSGTLGIVKAASSRLTSFAPAEGVTLTDVTLPDTLQSLALNGSRVVGLTYLPSTTLRSVTMRNVTGSWPVEENGVTANMNVKGFVTRWLGLLSDAQLAEAELTLSGINWTGMSVAQVLEMGKVGTKNLQGKVTLSSMTQAEYQQLVSLFGASVFNAGNEFVIDAPTGVAIAADKSQIEPEGTGQVTATLFPVTDGATIVFQLYKDSTMINPVNDIATVDGISLNTTTGAITTTSAAGGTVKVRAAATVGGNTTYSDYVTILVEPLTYPSSIIITGSYNIQEAGSYNYTKAFNTDNFTAQVLSVVWSLSGGSGVVAITSQQAGQATLAVSEVTENEVEVTLTCTATLSNNRTVTGTKSITIKEPSASGDFVDLGLPSGVKWATCNVGATNPEDPGLYFSWGNTEGHAEGSGYNFDSTTYNGTAAASISANLSLSQDAARANMGGNWRMPTKEETKELYDNTDREWTTINGMNGWKFMKKSDHSVFIFLPAAGYYYGTSLNDRGSYGCYWSASFLNSSSAYFLYFNSSSVDPQSDNNRYYGFSVRAVL